jgi:Mg-chelatase subunit ChlD
VALFLAGVLALGVWLAPATAQDYATKSLEGYGLKIYRAESMFYPFVQVYFRTFDQNQQPLVNLNELNIGLMVKGKSYDVAKAQYRVQSLRNREEAIRSVIVMDASKSMAGQPFEAALDAAARYIDSKRDQDQIAILAIRDTDEGYEIVSNFERDPATLGRRLRDVRADGMRTRLYDTLAAALQMSAMVSQGTATPGGADYVVSSSIVVFSDGEDDGSAISRAELNGRITNLSIPIPIYSIAYSQVSSEYFKNLEALSKNSFGVYYNVGEALEKMTRVVEGIQHILQNDYVVTFRSYIPVDGESHAFKLGVEYPSRSGKVTYQSGRFEALEAPPVGPVQTMLGSLEEFIPRRSDGNPYLTRGTAPPME